MTAINRTLVISMDFVLAEIDRRRNLFSTQRGIALVDSYDESRKILNAGVVSGNSTTYSSCSFSSIENVFALVTSGTVNIQITKSGNTITIPVTDTFVITGPIDSVTVTNPSTSSYVAINTIVG
jgi:hypothetical protein